jgi:carbonic anhydrase
MEDLLRGYRRFRQQHWPEQRRLFETLAEQGQRPTTLLIGCSDSRVDPAIIFDAAPGQIFVVRNVANIVPPYQPDPAYHGTSAAIEFGVLGLEVRNVVVMGHGLCGGVRALVDGVPSQFGDFLAPWISVAAPARRVLECAPADPHRACEEEVVRLSLTNLRTFPWIAERVASGRLRLFGAHFDVHTGMLALLGEDGAFAPVT